MMAHWLLSETMMAEDVDIKEETDAQEEAVKDALAEIRETSPDENAQDEKPEIKEVSSEYFAGYKAMIAEMKA